MTLDRVWFLCFIPPPCGKVLLRSIFLVAIVCNSFMASLCAQVSNPIATRTCGNLHIALLVDESGSIQGTDISQLRNGLLSFIASENGSGNRISLIE